MRQNASRWKPVLLLVLATAGVLWGGWKWSRAWHVRRALSRVEDTMEAGLYALAAKDLVELLEQNPGSDEAAFLLGTCERARGRAKAADDAWAKVPPHSPFALRALQGRVELEVEQGRLSGRAAHQGSA